MFLNVKSYLEGWLILDMSSPQPIDHPYFPFLPFLAFFLKKPPPPFTIQVMYFYWNSLIFLFLPKKVSL